MIRFLTIITIFQLITYIQFPQNTYTQDIYQETIFLPIIFTPENKAGYAWSDMGDELESLFSMSYAHTWDIHEPTSIYVPHFSCDVRPYDSFDDPSTNQFNDLRDYMNGLSPDESFYLIFLNEPDLWGQCNRTPYHAAHLYKKLIEVAPNAIIVGPQVSHDDYANDWEWLREWYYWIDRLNLPYPAIGGIHTYIEEPAHLMIDSHMSLFPTEGIWITEFGTDDPNVMQDMLTTYQNNPHIQRYFYFDPLGHYAGWEWLRLIDTDTMTLTPVGQVWVDNH